MEGAVLGGKLAAEVVANRAIGNADKPIKEIQQNIVDTAATHVAKEPLGVKGDGAIAFGAGATLEKKAEDLLKESDPIQFAATRRRSPRTPRRGDWYPVDLAADPSAENDPDTMPGERRNQ